jgi:hypothetical protein
MNFRGTKPTYRFSLSAASGNAWVYFAMIERDIIHALGFRLHKIHGQNN